MSQSPNQIPCLPHRSQRTLEGRSISVRLQKDSHKLSSNYLKCGAHVELPPISCETYLFPRCSPDEASLRHFYRKSSLFWLTRHIDFIITATRRHARSPLLPSAASTLKALDPFSACLAVRAAAGVHTAKDKNKERKKEVLYFILSCHAVTTHETGFDFQEKDQIKAYIWSLNEIVFCKKMMMVMMAKRCASSFMACMS